MWRQRNLAFLVVCAACGGNGKGPIGQPGAGDASVPLACAGADAGLAVPATIELHNRASREIELDTTFTPVDDLAIAPRDDLGLGVLSLRWPGPVCLCDPSQRCPDAARPIPASVTIAAGGTHQVSWPGQLTRLRLDVDDESCAESLAPPPARYLLRVCDRTGTVCGRSDVSLPGPGPIAIDLLAVEPRAPSRCPLEEKLLRRAAAAGVGQMAVAREDQAVAAGCQPAAAVCTSAGETAAPAMGCRIEVIPGDGELEVRITVAGKTRRYFTDVDGVKVHRVAL
jgi:hypothetical protein